MQMKLHIELVPETCWYQSLHRTLPKVQWTKIRRQTVEKAGNVCEICGASGKLYCHEIWEYDDKKRIQGLRGFEAVCSLCNLVKHIGLANILAVQGKLDYETVVVHFMKVNNVNREEFEKHRREAFALWKERSKTEWKTDFGELSNLLPDETSEDRRTRQ